jgi:hypothetical protein
MTYSVVPKELEADLLEPLRSHYADEPEVTVIVDRRRSERRREDTSAAATKNQRVVRDRRRRRVTGEFPPLEGEDLGGAAA